MREERYDIIMMDNKMLNANSKLKYVDGSYKAYGNDGNAYNSDINISNNGVVSETVAQALYNMSDHLPVVLQLQTDQVLNINENVRFWLSACRLG